MNHFKSTRETCTLLILQQQSCPLGTLLTEIPVEAFINSILQLLIPEAENNWTKEGGEDCIGGRHEGVSVK